MLLVAAVALRVALRPASRVTGAHVSILALAIAAGMVVPGAAQSEDLSGEVALASQLVDRGLAITPATPTVQAALFWSSPNGWSVGVSAGSEAKTLAKPAETQAQLSRHVALSDDWQMQGSLLYYHVAAAPQVRTYDRTEAGIDWIYRDILTLGVSAIAYPGAKSADPRPAADLNVRWPLPWNFSISAGAGVAQYVIAPYHSSYHYDHTGTYYYGQAGLRWSRRAWRVEVNRIATDPVIRQKLKGLAASPWLASLSWSF
ncbi:hypothetical protein [Dyella sp. Tek66A03]|uniref:hypothetical protein n=1 Tax=Dyella sp. Tek66A03 TaxID=3458298 RepID=UPI00403E71B9